QRLRRRRRVRRGIPALRGGARHRDTPARRRPRRCVHAVGRGDPRGRRLDRWRPPPAPSRRDALREPVSLLPAAPGGRVAWRNLAAGMPRASRAGGGRVAGRAGADMKAVVLVGGFGTRLRPLTETIKKELLPLVDRPILDHVLDHLARHGVHEVILSSPYLEAA